VERHARDLLPPSWLDELTPFFLAARRGMTRSQLDWLEQVRVIPTAFSLRAPKIEQKVQALVCEALKEQRQLRFTYRKAGETDVQYDAVNPYGLVQRDKELILLATHARSDDELREFLLHRIAWDIELLNEKRTRKAGFTLDDYIHKGGFQYSSNSMQRVTLRVPRWLAVRLRETPLSDDQTIAPIDSDTWTVRATVPDSEGFKWWLMTFGTDLNLVSSEEGE
jgi:predicted DNA-binding transcriptional regulator YafY